MISQGDIWWANLPRPVASEPGHRRPVVVVQCERITRSRIQTVLCVVLTTNLRLAEAPGNVYLSKVETGLPEHSVANVSQLATVNKSHLTDQAGRLSPPLLELVIHGVLGTLGR